MRITSRAMTSLFCAAALVAVVQQQVLAQENEQSGTVWDAWGKYKSGKNAEEPASGNSPYAEGSPVDATKGTDVGKPGANGAKAKTEASSFRKGTRKGAASAVKRPGTSAKEGAAAPRRSEPTSAKDGAGSKKTGRAHNSHASPSSTKGAAGPSSAAGTKAKNPLPTKD
ncbi:MAG TPA: hypothetical protein V6D17_05725 [Candidatus Obscuribacterales bacterium]